MSEKKLNLKEEIKEELRESSVSHITEKDLEIDKNIDDKYTHSALNKYKKGFSKNKWFSWSGALSITFGVACIVIMIIIGSIFVMSSERFLSWIGKESADYESEKVKIITCCIVVPIIGLIAIGVGMKIKSYERYTKEKLIENLFSIFLFAILQFIFGGLIFVVLTIVGYFTGVGSDYGVIFYNRIDRGPQKDKELADAKTLYQNDLINYEEYTRLKTSILHDDKDK